MSISLRRAAAPSFIILRSSGQKSTVFSVSLNSDAVFLTPFTLICFLTPCFITMRTVCSLPPLSISASISQKSLPKPNSSRSKRVRKLLPHESRYTASSRFVLPCALAPYMTFVAGEKLTVSKS